MNKQTLYIGFGICFITLCFVWLAGCGAPAEAVRTVEVMVEVPREESAAEPVIVEKEVVVEAPAEEPSDQTAGESAENDKQIYTSSSGQVNRPNRLIIKDGQMYIIVTDTDQAIDRVTQVVSDLGGYIISSRTWSQPYLSSGVDQKFATMTMGIPVDRFEDALIRLRQIAVKVKDESASGEDVSDEYVDLQSRLKNLEATRDRIQTFLDTAATVEEALKVNDQLSEVEAEIEQVRGRMNYLFDRASYSTISLQIEPEAPFLTPTPTPTITPTPTPTATPTPAVWQPQQTWTSANRSMRSIWKGVGDFLIYFFTVVFPCLLPFIVLGLLIWYFAYFRKILKAKKEQKKQTPDKVLEDNLPGPD